MNFYNENDKFCVQWLKNLVDTGLIPPGTVCSDDIQDVTPVSLAGFTQCHFFAGIAMWSEALRMAGWPDNRSVWTGSCPCQPFSQAGKGAGFADERHLWPAWFWLIGERRPDTIFGEQVASPAGRAWLDLVFTDLEGIGYACGAAIIPSAGVGAPNIRHRIFWVADARCKRSRRERFGCNKNTSSDSTGKTRQQRVRVDVDAGGASAINRMADTERQQRERREPESVPARLERFANSRGLGNSARIGSSPGTRIADVGYLAHKLERSGHVSGLGDAVGRRLSHTAAQVENDSRWEPGGAAAGSAGGALHPWCEFEWLDCADGKRRPTQPGIFPLSARNPGDVGKLRAYGNAINPWVAAEFIKAFMDIA